MLDLSSVSASMDEVWLEVGLGGCLSAYLSLTQPPSLNVWVRAALKLESCLGPHHPDGRPLRSTPMLMTSPSFQAAVPHPAHRGPPSREEPWKET